MNEKKSAEDFILELQDQIGTPAAQHVGALARLEVASADIEITIGGKSFPVRSVSYSDRAEAPPRTWTPGVYRTDPIRRKVRWLSR